MARISRETVESVREAVDIAEVVSARTELRRAGQQLTGLCPFHEERTPSFSVDPARKLYHCFGCGAGGTVFDFVMETEGLSFAETVETLAARCGIEVERDDEDPEAEVRRRRRERLHELLARAASYYAEILWRSDGARAAREHLRERGLGEEALRAFGVGFAPKRWDTMLVRGQRAGFTPDELREAGLVKPSQKGRGLYDHFRGRITFPIRDPRGRVLGFGARRLGDGEGAKYVNSPDTGLFHKRSIVYGLDRARAAIARSGRAVLVEGYTDVIALHEAGMEEAVAAMGTSVTPDQLAALSAHASELVLALDADQAGHEAMVRAHEAARARRMRVLVVPMPEEADPCDVLQRDGAEGFEEMLRGAVEFPEFQVERILGGGDLSTPAGRDRVLDAIAPVLSATDGVALRDELERRVANRLDLEPSLVRAAVARGASRERAPGLERDLAGPAREGGEEPEGDPGSPAVSTRERLERTLLAMCMADPKGGREYLERTARGHLSSDLMERARAWLLEHPGDPLAEVPEGDAELERTLQALARMSGREPASASAMEVNWLRLEQRRLEAAIGEAARDGDDAGWRTLVREREAILERLRGISGESAAEVVA